MGAGRGDRSMGEAAMRTLVIALASITLLTAPAYAQTRGKGSRHAGSEQQSAEKKKATAESAKAYSAALDSLPDRKYDPWRDMR
jgi:phage head maturation protease